MPDVESRQRDLTLEAMRGVTTTLLPVAEGLLPYRDALERLGYSSKLADAILLHLHHTVTDKLLAGLSAGILDPTSGRPVPTARPAADLEDQVTRALMRKIFGDQ